MRALAEAVDDGLRRIHGKRLGFLVMTADFEELGICDWVSNIDREDAVTMITEWLMKQSPEVFEKAVQRVRDQRRFGPEVSN